MIQGSRSVPPPPMRWDTIPWGGRVPTLDSYHGGGRANPGTLEIGQVQ